MEESELIDYYLQGRLPSEEINFVENKVTNDKEFKAKVILRKAIIAGISEAYSEELKEKLTEFDRSLETKKLPFRFSWKTAAMLAGFLVMFTALIFKFSLSTSNQSLEKYDLTEIGIPNLMGSASQLQFAEAMNDFKSENYKAALNKFQSLLKSKPDNDTLLYFTGVSAYRTRQYSLAINSFNVLTINSKSEYSQISEYRLALCYLSNGEKQTSRELFLKVSKNKKHKFRSDAMRILNEHF